MGLTAWADVATIVTGVAAVVALVGAAVQIREARRSQREATAAALYGNYLATAIQYPQLSAGRTRSPTGFSADFEQYEWFVSLMLHAFEQILALEPGDPVWRTTIADQLQYHRAYLVDERFVRNHYSGALIGLLDDLQMPRHSPPRSDQP
jgi:hypothetical protein